MNKTQLIKNISKRTGLTQKDIKRTLNEFENAIVAELQENGKVNLLGFGTFKTTERKARNGRNPQTNQPLVIPAHKAPVFKFSGSVKKLFK